MAILGTDLLLKGSVVTGSAGNAVANGGAGTNLGNKCSSGNLTDATLNNLFPDATGDENAASNVDYQCYFIHNNHGSLTLQNAVAWIPVLVAGGAVYSVGVDTTAASAVGSAGAQAVTIANKNTAPAGITFVDETVATVKGSGVSVGNIGPGQVKGIWIKRACANTAALNNDGATLRVEGDTVA